MHYRYECRIESSRIRAFESTAFKRQFGRQRSGDVLGRKFVHLQHSVRLQYPPCALRCMYVTPGSHLDRRLASHHIHTHPPNPGLWSTLPTRQCLSSIKAALSSWRGRDSHPEPRHETAKQGTALGKLAKDFGINMVVNASTIVKTTQEISSSSFFWGGGSVFIGHSKFPAVPVQ